MIVKVTIVVGEVEEMHKYTESGATEYPNSSKIRLCSFGIGNVIPGKKYPTPKLSIRLLSTLHYPRDYGSQLGVSSLAD